MGSRRGSSRRARRPARPTRHQPETVPLRMKNPLSRVLGALVLCLLGAGCAGEPVRPEAPTKPFTYLVGAGDVLAVEVFDEAKLQREVVVAPDGRITFPLVGT